MNVIQSEIKIKGISAESFKKGVCLHTSLSIWKKPVNFCLRGSDYNRPGLSFTVGQGLI